MRAHTFLFSNATNVHIWQFSILQFMTHLNTNKRCVDDLMDKLIAFKKTYFFIYLEKFSAAILILCNCFFILSVLRTARRNVLTALLLALAVKLLLLEFSLNFVYFISGWLMLECSSNRGSFCRLGTL